MARPNCVSNTAIRGTEFLTSYLRSNVTNVSIAFCHPGFHTEPVWLTVKGDGAFLWASTYGTILGLGRWGSSVRDDPVAWNLSSPSPSNISTRVEVFEGLCGDLLCVNGPQYNFSRKIYKETYGEWQNEGTWKREVVSWLSRPTTNLLMLASSKLDMLPSPTNQFCSLAANVVANKTRIKGSTAYLRNRGIKE